jgi:ubiquinone/menaquinone biosynthesis C-methylase UbiE
MPFGSIELASAYDELSDPQFTHGRDLLGLLVLKPAEHVLDLGCGTGRLTSIAAGLVGADGYVLGIDPAPARIEIARRRLVSPLEYRVGGAEDLASLESAAFDVVYLNSVLNWIVDKARALHEAHRVLKPGGRLGISTTVRDRPNELWQLARKARDAISTREDRSERGGTELDEGKRRTGGRGGKSGVTMEETRAVVERAGFALRIFDNRTYRSHFKDVAQMIEFLQATTYDNLLPGTTAAEGERFRIALERALAETIPERRRTNGIELERYVLLAVADKPA